MEVQGAKTRCQRGDWFTWLKCKVWADFVTASSQPMRARRMLAGPHVFPASTVPGGVCTSIGHSDLSKLIHTRTARITDARNHAGSSQPFLEPVKATRHANDYWRPFKVPIVVLCGYQTMYALGFLASPWGPIRRAPSLFSFSSSLLDRWPPSPSPLRLALGLSLVSPQRRAALIGPDQPSVCPLCFA